MLIPEVRTMGLSSPGRVLQVGPDNVGVVDIRGVPRRVRLALVTSAGTRVGVGDWLLVQLGLAVAWLSPDEADDLTRMIDEARMPALSAA
jgi:hydrogenase assembly chaperone HypC/HupF